VRRKRRTGDGKNQIGQPEKRGLSPPPTGEKSKEKRMKLRWEEGNQKERLQSLRVSSPKDPKRVVIRSREGGCTPCGAFQSFVIKDRQVSGETKGKGESEWGKKEGKKVIVESQD